MHRIALILAVIFAAGAAHAQDVPKRKSGLWEITRTTVRTEGKPKVIQWCIDQKTDNAVYQLAEGMRNESCKVDKMKREGDKLLVDGVCTLGTTHSTSKTHAVITGSFDSAYKIESTSIYDPPMRGKAEGSSTMSARWVGPCKPDQKPGDVVLPNGTMMHASDDESGGKRYKHQHDVHQDDAQSGGKSSKTQPTAPTK
jgi:hypothetical protein